MRAVVFATALSSILSSGCTGASDDSQSRVPTLQPSNAPGAKSAVSDGKIEVLGLHNDGTSGIPVGAEIAVEGTYRSEDPEMPVELRIVSVRNGREVVENSALAPSEKSGDTIRFKGKIKMPAKAGKYTIQAKHQGTDLIADREVNGTSH